MKADTKITVRISKIELDEIDDYLARTIQFKSRSEFIRSAVMKYIKDENQNVMVDLTKTYISLNPRTLNVLEDLVDLGFFNTVDEALNYIIVRATIDRFIPKILHELISSQSEMNRELDLFKEEFPLKNHSKKLNFRGEK